MNVETRLNSALDVRGQFPAIANWHYLDTAATAQKPQAVIDAVDARLCARLRHRPPRRCTSVRPR